MREWGLESIHLCFHLTKIEGYVIIQQVTTLKYEECEDFTKHFSNFLTFRQAAGGCVVLLLETDKYSFQ